MKEGQVIRFGGREDGSADFRASKESVLIALTACGEKHAAFKTQALTCGLDVIGEHDAWPQVPLACVSTADPSKKKPFSVACLRAAALGVKLVQPSYLEAWQSRNPLKRGAAGRRGPPATIICTTTAHRGVLRFCSGKSTISFCGRRSRRPPTHAPKSRL